MYSEFAKIEQFLTEIKANYIDSNYKDKKIAELKAVIRLNRLITAKRKVSGSN